MPDIDPARRRRRIAENEALYRNVNERLQEVRALTKTESETFVIVCECGDRACAEQIEVEKAAYERVRSDPTLFIIVPGHAIPDVEIVVGRRADRYEVVAKNKEPGASVAKATDPRS
jgi:hypothetical protein